VADVSVRPAVAADVPEIARVQVQTWQTGYARLLPAGVLAAATPDRAVAAWTAAVTAPPSPRHRVLVALEQHSLVGFAAFGPVQDDPAAGEIHTLLVEPRWGRRGHGSRLLAATVAGLRDAGAARALAWVLAGDDASSRFYRSAGWEPDGYTRRLAGDDGEVREERLHVSLLESEGAQE
jgi:L-amino acid N-acyltransferase YncA